LKRERQIVASSFSSSRFRPSLSLQNIDSTVRVLDEMLRKLLVLATLATLALTSPSEVDHSRPTPTENPLLVKRQATNQQSATSSTVSIPGTAAWVVSFSLEEGTTKEALADSILSSLLWRWTSRAGGLTYLTPAQTAAASYYKIASGNPITFGWNYTSL